MTKEEKKKKRSQIKLNDLLLLRVFQRFFQVLRYGSYALGIVIVLSGVTYLFLKSRPLPLPDNYAISKIYDTQNHYIGQTETGQPHEKVSLSKMPTHLIQATLAAEDKNFYNHIGFSLKGIVRATLANAQAGEIRQGASTITQQLARNLYLTHDRTWTRKIKEALLTFQLEIHYSKKQILEMYLNNIYYGHGCYGVGRAAQVYFHKNVGDLTLAECAFLAGIPRGPQYYSPYFHKKRATNRQQDILDLMSKNNDIASTFSKQARHQPIAIEPLLKPKQVNHSYFRDYIIQIAVTRYGLDENIVRHGGLKIYTTLDPKAQEKAEEVVDHYLRNKKGLQGALLSVDPRTGYIKAMVGGKNYTASQYNRVFGKRQPGSTFKPFLYLSALQNGFTPLTKIISKPTSFAYDGKKYAPSNFGGEYANRSITLREAIARSDNIYAVTTQFQVGFDNEMKTAHDLGISSTLKPMPSLALGTYPVSPFELSQAYASIAANGIQHPLIGIRRIVDPYGRVIVEEKPEAKRVAPAANTFVLTQLMKSVFEPGGTATRVKQMLPHVPMAGKTGSTDWDSWIAGFTPDLVTTVWVGYDQNKKLTNFDGRMSQYIWGKYMKAVTAHKKYQGFSMPYGVKAVDVDTDTGYIATSNCPHHGVEYFVNGTEPTISCPYHPETGRSMMNKFIKWIKGDKH